MAQNNTDNVKAPDIARPGVVAWFQVYAVLMMLAFLIVFVLGVFILLNAESLTQPDPLSLRDPKSTSEAYLIGAFYTVVGVLLTGGYLYALCMPRGKAAWVYGLVMICLGIITCTCIPMTIPLLIFWAKQDCKNWFCQAAKVPGGADSGPHLGSA